MTLKLKDGKQIEIDTRKYDALDFGYVLTYHAAQGASVRKAVMVLDRAASAELFFVGASRSKESLRIHYSSGNFGDVREIVEHVASKSSLKTTSQNYEEMLAKSAGNDPMRKKVLEQIVASDDHPLRKKYDAIEGDKRTKKATELGRLRKQYAKRAAEISLNIPLTERLERTKALEREHRDEARKIVAAYKPTQFGRFVRDEMQAQELERQRQRERSKTPEKRAQDKLEELQRQNRRVIDASKQTPQQQQQEKDKGHEYER